MSKDKPDIGVGYNIHKSDVNVKQFYDDIDLTERDRVINLIAGKEKHLKDLQSAFDNRLISSEAFESMKKEIKDGLKYLKCYLINMDEYNRDLNKKLAKMKLKKQEQLFIDLKKAQEQVSNKSFTKMCFSTNMQEEKRFNPETGYGYEIKQHDKLTNILHKDVLFNRFMAKCVQLTCEDEETLIEMFAEFLTMMSGCENRKQDK